MTNVSLQGGINRLQTGPNPFEWVMNADVREGGSPGVIYIVENEPYTVHSKYYAVCIYILIFQETEVLYVL